MAHIKQSEHLKIQLETIKSATSNFAEENLIGQGGFGKVYKGEIDHSKGKQTMVALKRLDSVVGQGDPEFWKEIMLLCLYKHENIVSLLGYCDDSGEKILVYEYASKKSLDLYLNNDEMTWVRRLKICIGAARGLAYLHTPVETQLRVLHRDIKSSNILLDENWNAKIADFGLSKFAPANKHFSYQISNAVGTLGYCDPLYIESGLLTKESDVYSFGVVLFEVLCGRLCIGNNNDTRRPLIGLVREYYERNKISELIYSNMNNEINQFSLRVFTKIAYQCLKRDREERPLMSQIVEALESALKYQCPEPELKPHPTGILNVKVLRTGILIVKVVRTTGLGRSLNPFATSNPYLILKLTNDSLLDGKKSSVKHKEINPEWNEEFTLYVEDFDDQCLYIYVNNVVLAEKHNNMGKVSLKLKTLTPETQVICDLEIMDASYKCIGNLKVEAVYKPFTYDQIRNNMVDVRALQKAPTGTPEGGGLLVVIIHEARLHNEMYHPHASISLLFRGELRNTTSMMNTKYPVWEQEFTYMLQEPPKNEELQLEVINNSRMGFIPGKTSLGYVNISLEEVVIEKRTISRYRVKCPNSSTVILSSFLEVELQWRTTY